MKSEWNIDIPSINWHTNEEVTNSDQDNFLDSCLVPDLNRDQSCNEDSIPATLLLRQI